MRLPTRQKPQPPGKASSAMQAVILAGGPPNRLHPVDTAVPKPMLPLFDRPVLEHTIKLLARHGIEDVIVTLSREAIDLAHYFGDGRRFGVRIRYSVESEPLGTGGALRAVQEMITGTFVVVPGDVITDIDLAAALADHRTSGASVTVLTYQADDPTLYTCLAQIGTRIARVAVKPTSDQAFTNRISTGIAVFDREILSLIPPFERRDIDREIFPRLIHNREPVCGCRAQGYWCDAGHPLAYKNAHFDALAGKLKIDLPAKHVGGGVWLGERVEIHPTAEITGPAYIGAGAVVRSHAVLGERTVIGEDTLVEEGARISHSIIGTGCVIAREAAITGSVVGAGYYAPEGESIAERTLIEHVEYARREAEPEPATAKDADSTDVEAAGRTLSVDS